MWCVYILIMAVILLYGRKVMRLLSLTLSRQLTYSCCGCVAAAANAAAAAAGGAAAGKF